MGQQAEAMPPRPGLPPVAINSTAQQAQPPSQSDGVAHVQRRPLLQPTGGLHGSIDRRSPSPQPAQPRGLPTDGAQVLGMQPPNSTPRPLDPRVKPRVPAAVPRPAGPAAAANGHAAQVSVPHQHLQQGHPRPAAISRPTANPRPVPIPRPVAAGAPQEDGDQPARLRHDLTQGHGGTWTCCCGNAVVCYHGCTNACTGASGSTQGA